MTQKEAAFVEALLTSRSVAAAARKVGLAERTARRWARRPAVQAALAGARQEMLLHGLTRVIRSSGRAAAALQRNLTCGQPAIEVSAARAVLDLALRAVEQADLERRVSALEATLGEGDDPANEEGWRH